VGDILQADLENDHSCVVDGDGLSRWLYTQLPLSNDILWFLGFPLGFFSTGYYAGVGAFLTELFPTRLRGSGQGFCYNCGRGIGALFPFLVGWLSSATSLAKAIGIFAVAAYSLFFLAAFALPETRGRVLHPETVSRIILFSTRYRFGLPPRLGRDLLRVPALPF
jgi:hypothetical protein